MIYFLSLKQTGGLQLWASEVNEQHSKHRKRMSDSLLQKFEKIAQSFSSSSPISSSLLVCFEWIKTRWVCQLRIYKTSFYSRGKNTTIKDIKLKILICFKSPIVEHWTPLHQTPHIFPHPLSNWAILTALEALDEGLQIFFELQKQRNNVWGFHFLWLLKCSLTGVSTLTHPSLFPLLTPLGCLISSFAASVFMANQAYFVIS